MTKSSHGALWVAIALIGACTSDARDYGDEPSGEAGKGGAAGANPGPSSVGGLAGSRTQAVAAGQGGRSTEVTEDGGGLVGGSVGRGGSEAQAGRVSLGGAGASGGRVAQAGGVGLGGSRALGGNSAEAGAAAQAGSAAEGGSVPTGGSVGKGGSIAQAGAEAFGGTVAQAGSVAEGGGATAAGGVSGGTAGFASGGVAIAEGGSPTGGAPDAVGGSPPGDGFPPLVEVTPADGTRGVTDVPVVVSFGEPMNTATVAAAFPNATSITWNETQSVATLLFDFPFQTTRSVFALTLPTTISDASGTPLAEPVVVTYELAAVQTAALEFNQTLSGHMTEGVTTTYTYVRAGDNASGARDIGGISFDLVGLPALESTLGLRSATLHIQVGYVYSNPSALGGIWLEEASFAARSGILTAIVGARHVLYTEGESITVGLARDLDISTYCQTRWAEGATTLQFRALSGYSNLDAADDVVQFRRTGLAAENAVDATLTALGDDLSNRLHVVVQYYE